MTEKSKWQKEFDALPEWAQKMVRAATHCLSYGSSVPQHSFTDPNKHTQFNLVLPREHDSEWFDGFCDMRALADALTAPWPPPPPPERERRAFNLVEMMADEDCAFDQPCAFGHRVDSHAVYCHNEAWPNSPRKCRRNRHDYRHEDCPGFVGNPDWAAVEERTPT